MLKVKYPIEYEFSPTEIEKGTNWITLKLKNVGTETFTKLDLQFHSADTYNLQTYGTFYEAGPAHYIKELKPNGEIELCFRINALGSANAFATIRGLKDGKYFWWESSWINLHVNDEKAKIERLLVLSNPYTAIGKTISAEATVMGLRENSGFKLEFWVETPSGRNEQPATIDIKALSIGEEARYTAEFTPKETGLYTISAILIDGLQRIGRNTSEIYAQT
jgi:hypothetical protein